MVRGRPVTAIIPVRGGSKGILGKNLREVGGRSLLERAILFAKASRRIEKTIVTTDDVEMHALAARHGVETPSLRPAHLADDAATTAAVVEHLIHQGTVQVGFILILQATSPFRTLRDLDDMCAALETSDADASVSLAALDEPRPEKLKRIVDGRVAPYLEVGFEGPRQALPQPYRLNGAFYLISTEAFVVHRAFLPPGTLPFLMPEDRSHNLDSESDWAIMEAMIATGRWSLENHG